VCGQCHHRVLFDPKPVQVHVQPNWQDPVINPVYSSVRNHYRWGNGNTTTTLHQSKGAPAFFSDAAVASLRALGTTEFNVTVGAGLYTVFFQHRVETWFTFPYVDPLPEDYSALPSDG
jgi:hypothetical protein